MRTRKLPALLLILVMSLTMGGVSVFADESGDADAKGPAPVITEPADQDSDPGDPDFDPDLFPEPDPEPSLDIKGIPTEPVKGGDTVSFTVEITPGDDSGWYLEVYDTLQDEIEDSVAPKTRRVEMENGKAVITYKIPENYFFYERFYYIHVHAICKQGETGVYGPETSFNLPADRIALTGNVEFKTAGLVTGKEYPFTVTWKNESDIAINNFSTDINVGATYGPEETGKAAVFKITSMPKGAVTEQRFRSVSVSNMSILAGQTIEISGTVLYPSESEEGYLLFEENINGKWFDRVGKSVFSISASTGENGNGNTGQQPGTETSGNVVKDSTTGITVSGVESGVELSIKSVSKEQQAAIEEQVKKLLEDTKGIKIFDISLLKDGKEVEPGAPVKVTIPIPDGFSTNLKLYHQNEKGELEAVNISVKDSVISFEAKSFSPYVLVDMGAKAANPANPANSKSPQTGDTSSIMLYLMLALAAMGSVGAATKRRMNG